MHRLIQLWRNILRREKMGGRTLRVWGFPLGAGAGEVKEFLEGHAGVGTVFALKFRLPKNRGRNSRAYAVVQFTGRRFAEIILAKALGGLIYGGFALKAEEMERDIVPRPREPMFELHGSTLHLGCLLSDDRLSVLLPCSAVRFNFSRNMRNIVFFLSWGGRDYKLESSFESIWEIQLHHSREQRKDFLMLLVVAAPRIYVLPQHSSGTAYEDPRYNYFKDPDDDRWIRATDFTPSCSIGQSSAFCLELPYDCSLPDISQMFAYFKELDSDLQLEPGSSYSHGRDLVPIVEPSPGLPVPYGVLFKVNHMVQNGTLSGPTLDDEFFGLLIPGFVPLSYIEYALERLSYSKTCCFAPAKWLREQYEKLRESKQDTISVRISLRPGLVYIHRAHITPSKVYFYGPEINVSNRVIRHYKDDLENFMRVSFVDEGGERMRSVDLLPRVMSESPNRHTDVYRRILSTLKNGIAFGGKRFEFLAFSSSQLKDSSAWMFASRPGLCAADIRRWMGTFSHIRNVAKHAARLGQSFGSSTETLAVGKHEVEMIPDVENEAGYLFSDGIGKISAAFAKEVAEKCGLRISTPSAFQIRYGGFKGVVAVDPTSRVKLSLRKSMSKFDSNNTKLDVLAYSKHQACYLNRQLITLLSTLGVRDQVFERKQEELVARLDVMLTDPVRSLEVLDAINHGEMAGILKEMLSCGYSPRGEPFLSMMLRTFRACKLFELRTRSRIFIPMGRSMMGCLDETGTLEYGQVFVQVSCHRDGQLRDDGLQMFSESSGSGGPTGRVVVTGKLIVSKNPCLHPGDIRTLLAVDVPALRHMVDCVVFPQKGKRPHPNECSGSDLDGDVYFVSWDPELIPPRQVPPMDYTPAPQDILNRDVTIDDVLVYFTNYLVNDSLGVISNAHTVFADKEPRMAESNACVELAKLFSIAVDFPKTGVPAVIPSRLTVKEYPDFMEKLNKATYESKRVIGKLFRAVRDHDPSALPTEFTRRDAARCYDRDMEVNGFRDHLKDAAFFKGAYDLKLGKLMDNYEIKTEAEILVGGVTKVSKAFNRYRDGEAVRLAVKSLRKEARSWFNRGDGAREDEEDDDPSLAKASAWYHVTYHPDYWGCYNEGPARPHFLSFPWCVHEKLVLIKQMNARPLVG